jgi:hypothetical protein
VEVVGHWWNGRWGRLARRDVWLHRDDDSWIVAARQGDGESNVWHSKPSSEAQARTLVADLLARGGEHWTDLTTPREN